MPDKGGREPLPNAPAKQHPGPRFKSDNPVVEAMATKRLQDEYEARDREKAMRSSLRYQRRIERAEQLLLYVKIGKLSLCKAWRQVVPESRCNDNTATHRAGDTINWYLKTFPMDIKEAMQANGITIYGLARKLNELMDAVMPNGRPDGRTQLKAVELGMQLYGVAGRNGHPPASDRSPIEELPAQLLLPAQEGTWDDWQKLADETNEKLMRGEQLKDEAEDEAERVPQLPVPLPKEGEPWI